MRSWFLEVILSVMLGAAVIRADPSMKFDMQKLTIENHEKGNQFYGEWKVESENLNKGINVQLPVKTDLPDDMSVQLKFHLNGDDLPESDDTLCSFLHDEVVWPDIRKAGKPNGVFPKECPVKAGDYTVEKYVLDSNKLPPTIPDGKLTGTIEIFSGAGDPLRTVYIEAEISHVVPGVG